jgi:hypothetical protein
LKVFAFRFFVVVLGLGKREERTASIRYAGMQKPFNVPGASSDNKCEPIDMTKIGWDSPVPYWNVAHKTKRHKKKRKLQQTSKKGSIGIII